MELGISISKSHTFSADNDNDDDLQNEMGRNKNLTYIRAPSKVLASAIFVTSHISLRTDFQVKMLFWLPHAPTPDCHQANTILSLLSIEWPIPHKTIYNQLSNR